MKVYLDYASTTYLDKRVFEAMMPYLAQDFLGNASSIHTLGRLAKQVIDQVRESAAQILNCKSREIIFTSGGTEADNLAVLGVYRKYRNFGNALLISATEHHAVLHPAEHLRRSEGTDLKIVPVNNFGQINLETLENFLNEKTTLVSIIYANNEIGTINKIKEAVKIVKKFKGNLKRKENEPPFFHTDASQAAEFLELDVQKLGIDLMTINGGKIYGPKGAGLLYVRDGVNLEPTQFGGGQEFGLRPGTEDIASIVGLAKALELTRKDRESKNRELTELRDYLIKELLKIPGSNLNGHPRERLPNNINMQFNKIDAEALTIYLDAKEIYVSTGSACATGELEPSHVLRAIGLSKLQAKSSVRMTLGRNTTKIQLDYVLKILPEVVKKLRSNV